MHLLFLNPGNEGLSCEYIGMPTITRRLASLWSVAFGICIFDVVFHYLYKTRRVEAWLTCQRVQPWVPVCVAARVIHLFLAMKTFDDQSSVGRSSTSILLVMCSAPANPFLFLHAVTIDRFRCNSLVGTFLAPLAKAQSWPFVCCSPRDT